LILATESTEDTEKKNRQDNEINRIDWIVFHRRERRGRREKIRHGFTQSATRTADLSATRIADKIFVDFGFLKLNFFKK
jgi:hypothetical protein